MNVAGWLLRRAGWHAKVCVDIPAKCVICVAPHTSNWDFILGELWARSEGFQANFLMKSQWFFFPLSVIMRALGGIPVDRNAHRGVTDSVVAEFARRDVLHVAVTPEGTRSANPKWHHGFLHIARKAHVPILLAYIDYRLREIGLDRLFTPSENPEADMRLIKQYYSKFIGRFPEKFDLGDLTPENS